jgi:hypothetical protein
MAQAMENLYILQMCLKIRFYLDPFPAPFCQKKVKIVVPYCTYIPIWALYCQVLYLNNQPLYVLTRSTRPTSF